MKFKKLVLVPTLLTALSLSAIVNAEDKTAESNTAMQMPMAQQQTPQTIANQASAPTPPQMPMMNMGNSQGGKPMMMQMMQKKQAMMQAHMKKMEQSSANIEALLRELVALQKAKN